MGDVNALNVWLALSRCGDEAPGLDVVPRRIDRYVSSRPTMAMFENMISQRMAEQAAGGMTIMRPLFEPGDALLFDELFLHKTGSDPSMPGPPLRGRELVLRRLGVPRRLLAARRRDAARRCGAESPSRWC